MRVVSSPGFESGLLVLRRHQHQKGSQKGQRTTTDYTNFSRTLLGEGVAAEKVFAQVGDGVVKGLARIARLESELTRRFRTVQVPEVLRHLDRSRLDRRRHVP